MQGSLMGTPAYMPPEQAQGRVDKLDERTDVFALGAILCEVLTGKPPTSRRAATRRRCSRRPRAGPWRAASRGSMPAGRTTPW